VPPARIVRTQPSPNLSLWALRGLDNLSVAEIGDLEAALATEFGPDWRTGDPAGEAAVAAFEAVNGVVLPPHYRAFLVGSANGAVGPPHYGLVALGEPAGQNSYHLVRPNSMAQAFPLTEFWLWDGTDDLQDPKSIERHRQAHEFGTVPLGTDGDGMDYVLVVTGAARGQVWMLSGEFATPVARDFEAWILCDYFPDARWLLDFRPRGGPV
jgi:SMI1 / KNR4 family (SUKH-1)